MTDDDQRDAGDVDAPALAADEFYEVLERHGRPLATASEVATALDCTHEAANRALDALADDGVVERRAVDADPVVWYPSDWAASVDRERVVTAFPERREVVADRPTQFTRARLSQFAHLTDATDDGAYRYEIRPADVWHAPYDDFDRLLDTVHDTVGVHDGLDGWLRDQWRRARQFRLYTHDDGYVVLEADSESLLGNVARPKLDDGELRGPISDTESWVNEDRVADVKRTLYDAGYPVRDDRDLDEGDALEVDLDLELRGYQRDWIDRFLDRGSGVLVGPPGSGKTVAAMGVLAAVGGETLVLVPSRELAAQWRDELLAKTTLDADQVGEYHGGSKEMRPVTVATYQTAGMDRHRRLFDARRWGLIVYDECHHIPAAVHRRSADLQGRHRLGLTATPVRESDDEDEIYALVGPPIGTDWDALFDAGFVAQPEVEIRYVPWADDVARSEYAAADGHDRRQQAATNPAKVAEVEHLLDDHDGKALVFVDYLDQGRAVADALDVPFVSGETRHVERERYFDEFRRGARDALVVSRVGDEGIDLPDAELAVVASGLGGSRRQGAQRAGRTMRPTGNSRVYVLATRGTEEEEFARRRTHHLAAKGVQVRESDAEAAAGED